MTINMALVNSSLATVDLNSTMVFSLGADKREPERLWEGRDSEDFVGIAPLPSPPPPLQPFSAGPDAIWGKYSPENSQI